MADVWIQEGDKVSVCFNNAQVTLCRKATVKSMAMTAGDCWVFRDDETGTIHYVNEGCTITLLEKANL